MNLRVHLNGWGRDRLKNALLEVFDVVPLERLLLSNHLVEHCGKAIKIGSAVGGFSANLFRRHVIENRGEPLGMMNELSDAGDSKAQNLDCAVPAAHDFCRFQAVVDELVGAGMIEAGA